jgi:hypothetical protein
MASDGLGLWDEDDDSYLESKRDKWGVQTDWGARGGPQAYGNMDHYIRRKRSWFRGRKTVKGSGEYKLNDADQFREWKSKYEGSKKKRDLMRAFQQDGGGGKQTSGAHNYSKMGLLAAGGMKPAYGGGYGGSGGEPESDEARAARLAREKEQKLQAADDKKSGARRKWWSRETSSGERGSVRKAMIKNKRAGQQAYRSDRDRSAEGWGYASGGMA